MSVFVFAHPASRTGKTTAASRMCLEMAGRGVMVLAIDADPRSELTRAFGIDADSLEQSLHEVLTCGADPWSVLLETDFGVDVLPAAPELSLAEGLLVTRSGRESVLRAALSDLRSHYDAIVIDCPSSLGLLTLNALAAADEIIVPGQPSPSRALVALHRSIDEIRAFVNPGLHVRD